MKLLEYRDDTGEAGTGRSGPDGASGEATGRSRRGAGLGPGKPLKSFGDTV